jgi:hypothetical protein
VLSPSHRRDEGQVEASVLLDRVDVGRRGCPPGDLVDKQS